MWILGLNAITKYVFFNNVMKVKIWKEAYPIVRKTPFLVCSETWEGIEIGWRSGILMSLYIFIILSIPLYSIITKIDFYNASDAEMIGLILSNASYYNGAGNLGEWNLSHNWHRVRQWSKCRCWKWFKSFWEERMIQSFCKKERVQNLFVRKKMIKIFWEKQSWKELILMEALPKLYLLDPTIQVLNAANSEHLKIKSFEKLAHSESETDDCGLLRNTFCIFTKLVVCCRDGRPAPRGTL